MNDVYNLCPGIFVTPSLKFSVIYDQLTFRGKYSNDTTVICNVLKPVGDMFTMSINDFMELKRMESFYENVIIAKSFGEYVLCISVNLSNKNGTMMSMCVEFALKTKFAKIQHFFVQQESYGFNPYKLSFCKGFVLKFLYKLAAGLHHSCGGAVALGNANQIHGSTGNAYFTQLFNAYVMKSKIPVEYIFAFPSEEVNVTQEAQQWCVRMGVTLSEAQIKATEIEKAVAKAHTSVAVNNFSKSLIKSTEEKKGVYVSDENSFGAIDVVVESVIAQNGEINSNKSIESINASRDIAIATINNAGHLSSKEKMDMVLKETEKAQARVEEVNMWTSLEAIIKANPNATILVAKRDGTNVLIGNTMQMTNAILAHSLVKKAPIRQIKSKKQFDFSAIQQ